MKRLILITLLLALGGRQAFAGNSPESITVTPKSGLQSDTTKNAPVGVGDDQLDHRFHTDNAGNLHLAALPAMSAGTGEVTSAWDSQTAQVYGTFTAGVLGPYMICFNPRYSTTGGTGISIKCLTLTAVPSDLASAGTLIPNSPTGGICYGPLAPGLYYAAIGYAGTITGTVNVMPVLP